MQRVMKTVVLYGEALGAERLVDIEGNGHFVISWATPGIAPSLEMLEELVPRITSDAEKTILEHLSVLSW